MVGLILVVFLFDFSPFRNICLNYGKGSFYDLSNQLPEQENLAARCK